MAELHTTWEYIYVAACILHLGENWDKSGIIEWVNNNY